LNSDCAIEGRGSDHLEDRPVNGAIAEATYSSPCPAVRTVGFLLRFGVVACFAKLASAARAYAVVMHRCFASCGRIADKSFRVSCDAVFRSKSESKKAVNALNKLKLL
jgi:hypothetical protein